MARPSKYKEEYAEQAYKLCLLGATDKDMADFFGVEESTINNWKKTKDGFLESLKSGKIMADAEVANSLYNRAKGYDHVNTKEVMKDGEPITLEEHKHIPADPTSIIYWLKNRQPDKWRDKREYNVSNDEFAEVTKQFLDGVAKK